MALLGEVEKEYQLSLRLEKVLSAVKMDSLDLPVIEPLNVAGEGSRKHASELLVEPRRRHQHARHVAETLLQGRVPGIDDPQERLGVLEPLAEVPCVRNPDRAPPVQRHRERVVAHHPDRRDPLAASPPPVAAPFMGLALPNHGPD